MKKACVISIDGQANPVDLVEELKGKGYSVELIKLEPTQFEEFRNCDPGKLPEDIRSKIETADLVVFFLSEAFLCEDGFDGLAQCAVGAGADIVGVWPSGSEAQQLPKTISDFGASVVSEDSADLENTIVGDDDNWELPDQSPAETVDKDHQKKC